MSSIVDSIKGSVKDLLSGTKKGPSVLGIDVSSSAIKIVQLRKKGGKAILETYGEIALGPYGDKEIGRVVSIPHEKTTEALVDVMKEAKVTTKNCGVAIPLSASLITTIEVPNVGPKKLQNIISLEARKYIPVPITEVMLDWYIIPEEEVPAEKGTERKISKSVKVLLVAIHKDTIANYQHIISNAGLNPSFFEIEVFSTIRAVLDRGITSVIVADFGSTHTKVYVIEHGLIKKSHIVNKGSQDITIAMSKSSGTSFAKAEEQKRTLPDLQAGSAVLSYIFSEIHRVMLDFEKRHNKPISEIVFSGGGALFPGLISQAKEKFNIEISLANPFKKVETPAFLESILTKAGPEFCVSLGVALRKLNETQ